MRKIRTNETIREYERNIPIETKLNQLTKEELIERYVNKVWELTNIVNFLTFMMVILFIALCIASFIGM